MTKVQPLHAINFAQDEVIARTANIYRSVRTNVNITSLEEEINTLHLTRLTRKLSSGAVTIIKLNKAITTDMQVRSRLIEVRCSIRNNLISLVTAIEVGSNHVQSTYAANLRSTCSTAQERKQAIDTIFERYIKLRVRIECLLDNLDSIIKDIDQSSYHLRNLVDIAKLTLGSNGGGGLEVT
jgi:hypothetical protein